MADRLERAISAALHGATPAPLAMMRLIMAAGSAAELQSSLAASVAAHRPGSDEQHRARSLMRLWTSQPDAWARVRGVLEMAVHDEDGVEEDAIARWTRIFDRAADVSPLAAVALYSLGDEGLLGRATDEVVRWLDERGLLHDRQDVVDLGCGVGRIAQRLAPRVRSVTAVDVSQGLLLHAKDRCGHLSNVLLVHGSGRDLACLRDGCASLILAVDVMPYLVAAGSGLVTRHLNDACRMLRPGGALVVMNWSYRGDDALDMADADELGREAGLMRVLFAETPFSHWDGRVYAFERPLSQPSCGPSFP